MMPLRSMPVLFALLACALLAGCARKKPVLVMPQEPPPATAPTPAPTPASEAKQEPAQPQPSPTPAPGETQGTAAATANNTKAKPHPTPKKPPQQVARGNKPVIENGSVPVPVPPPLTPEAQSQKAATEQLLQTTETAIKGITRQLSKEEQAILAQIKDFITQSRGALEVRDFVRARNLAQKAHLLSDELVKQK